VDLDPTSNGETFKLLLYSLTGVEPDRQKVLIKGGQLKDDTELSTLNAKPGQTFMMMGTASVDAAVITAPKEKIKFMEDMTDAEAAKLEGAIPAGLQNLGNTCYLNSTLQVLRSVPELQEDLAVYKPSPANGGANSLPNLSQFGLGGIGSSTDLTASLRDLYKEMSETQEGFPPLMFLNALRTAFPQFAQKSKTGHGYAQQDAEEAWSEIVSQLRQKLKIVDPNDSTKTQPSFVDRYLAGSFSSVLAPPPEAAEKEKSVKTSESFLKLDCHIHHNTNHLRDGILAGLSSQIEKRSDTLDRDATYTKTSQISRTPKYLTVHFVRFFWKRDSQKKAKIMKKVTFPAELDVVEFCTDELKKQLIPVRDKVREIRKDEQDVERARKRQKLAHKQEEDRKAEADRMDVEAAPIKKAQEAKERKEAEASGKPQEAATSDVDVYKTDAEYEAERTASIKAAKKELYAAIDPVLMADEGANKSGLYELRGVITHQGASADSGHYTSYVKKTARIVDDPTAPGGKRKEDDGKWWWFNDDKVSEVEAEKIETLSGGGKAHPESLLTANLMTNFSLGESHSALILLYRAIDLPTKDEIED
jgi:ubiquitin carboxyl-terminal hydrolase 14